MAAPPESDISSAFPFELKKASVLGSNMTYVDTGVPNDAKSKTTAIFIHGNPTSSYLYRNIIPHVQSSVRCVAPDLIGMGHSDKPPLEYRFVDHARYLDEFLSQVVPSGKVILVIQDWGSALGFHWANRHRDRVAGIAFMEWIRPFPSWDDAAKSPEQQEIFKAFRDPEKGRELIINQNMFLKVVVPRGAVRSLTPEEIEYYERPFEIPASREPVYRWPNEIPIKHHPADVYKLVEDYHDWLLKADFPKLFFYATPGRIVGEEKAEYYLKTLKNVKGVHVGQGLHFLQEDHPHRIGREIDHWLTALKL